MDFYSYPIKYITPIELKDGTLVQLRPIHPLDGSQAKDFKSLLSADSIYARFLGYIPKISNSLVKRLTEIDYSKEMAIVAELGRAGNKEIIAVARIASENPISAEFAIIIADKWQSKGLGTMLSDYMISIAKDMHFKSLYALVFSNNTQMLEILRHKGFTFKQEDEMTIRANLDLSKFDITPFL